MSDTSTPPEPLVEPMPEENKGKSRMWLYFMLGFGLLLFIAFLGARTDPPTPGQLDHPGTTVPTDK